jgi:segregation and condensation protein A
MSFEVSQPSFSGPFPVLLELLEAGKLPVSEVSLGGVADTFVRYLASGAVSVEEMADFLVVAARLIYLKSRLLLPVLADLEEEEEVALLEERLRAYQEFERVAKLLRLTYGVKLMVANPRTSLRVLTVPELEERSAGILIETYREMMSRLKPFLPEDEEQLVRVKTVEEVISEWRNRLGRARVLKLKEVLSQASKAEIVVAVMAILQMLQEHEVSVSQEEPFGEVWIHQLSDNA